jgi:septal ring factor EnvC (AmiA/AmiB activator)
MRKVLFAVICALMLFGIAAIGYAERGDWHGGIRDRIHAAKQSIERGIERGSLTRHEARKLNEELDGILANIDRMRSDGRLSEREREKINRDLDRLERDIAREKRDDDRRGDGERGDWHGGIRDRIQTAKQSIEQGIQHGSLTKKEARKLHNELDGILAKIDRMRSDGRLSEREREKINRDLDRLDGDILREKRDDNRRR